MVFVKYIPEHHKRRRDIEALFIELGEYGLRLGEYDPCDSFGKFKYGSSFNGEVIERGYVKRETDALIKKRGLGKIIQSWEGDSGNLFISASG